jgi:hypothetical protein
VQYATTRTAPCSFSAFAASHSVLAVSTMSSMITHVRPFTSPMMFITVRTFGRGRRLSMIARVRLEALGDRPGAHHAAHVRRHDDLVLVPHLEEVPEQDRRRVDVVHRMSKKPWIWSACRSIVSSRFTAGHRQHVRDDLGRDRDARAARAPVLPRVSEVRQRRR